MGAPETRRTISLTAEQARFVDELVSKGDFESESDVVAAGLEALQTRKESLDDWLRREVLPVVSAIDADPGRAIPIDDVFDEIRQRHEERLKDR